MTGVKAHPTVGCVDQTRVRMPPLENGNRLTRAEFALHERAHTPIAPDERGVLYSRVFPGLRLAVPALLADDLERVLAGGQQGLDTLEHKAFARALESESTA